jgi:hypothetical protein
MRKLLTNPFVVLGIVYVGYRLIRKKPSGAISRTFDEVVEGGGKIATTVGKAATSIIDTAVETGQDIFDIYDEGKAGDMLFGDNSTPPEGIETGDPVLTTPLIDCDEVDTQGNLVNEDDPACL